MPCNLQAVTEKERDALRAAVIVAAYAVASRSAAGRDWRLSESLRVLRQACDDLTDLENGNVRGVNLQAQAYESGTLAEASRLINAGRSVRWTKN